MPAGQCALARHVDIRVRHDTSTRDKMTHVRWPGNLRLGEYRDDAPGHGPSHLSLPDSDPAP